MYLKPSLLLLLFLQFSTCNVSHRNNVCKTFEDYLHSAWNRNCYYNPDASLPAPDIIRKYSGSVESHAITTEDGYILTMFRIPRSKPKGTILLQHSIAVDSRIFVGSGNESLGLILWAAGYDVWLANMRGTRYSQKHVNLTIADHKYWDFSFHEIGFYDVSSQIRYIVDRTGDSQIIYIGHSLGTTSGLVYASLKNQEAKKFVKVFILLSTVCYFEHVSSPIYSLQRFQNFFVSFGELFRIGSLIPIDPEIIYHVSRHFLRMFPSFLQIGDYFISFLLGWTPQEADPALLNYDSPIYLNNFPYKMALHYVQLVVKKNRFQMYDYGKEKNLELYGSDVPPEYPVGNISVPLFLVSSESDTLASVQDADDLFKTLPENLKIYGQLVVVGLNHFDFYFGKHRQEIFVDKLLDFLNNKLIYT